MRRKEDSSLCILRIYSWARTFPKLSSPLDQNFLATAASGGAVGQLFLPSKVSIPNKTLGKMKNKFTNTLIDFFISKQNQTIFKMWGGQTPILMGDGVRFRVTKSPKCDYVYVRYLSGYESYDVEFGALVGTDYDIIDRIKPVEQEHLMATISKGLFFGK
jgi:hypothetical protein